MRKRPKNKDTVYYLKFENTIISLPPSQISIEHDEYGCVGGPYSFNCFETYAKAKEAKKKIIKAFKEI